MSHLTKSDHMSRLVKQALTSDPRFTCAASYDDLMIWSRLCRALSPTQIFTLLPNVLNAVWTQEDTLNQLKARNARKLSKLEIQALAATIISFQRASHQDAEINALKQQVATLSAQFNTLSYNVFDILERLSRLEEENQRLTYTGAASMNELPPPPPSPH
ncbi:hypothetical protein [Terasakiella pusilla]|uniref:hypothetical protein n=1 Tax=Terasakiella pusilla TaxID=64973 RepID=UPI003AA8F788